MKEILPGEKWFFAEGRWWMGWHAQAEKRAAQKLLGVTGRRGYFVVGVGDDDCLQAALDSAKNEGYLLS